MATPQPQTPRKVSTAANEGGADSGAIVPEINDTRLQELVAAWPALNPEIRARILRLARNPAGQVAEK